MDSEQEYREKEAINYSYLKALTSRNVQGALDELAVGFSSMALSIGSLIDTLMFTPEEFDNKFHLIENNPPGGLLLQFCNYLIASDDIEDYKSAYSFAGYKSGYSLERVMKDYEANGRKYVEEAVSIDPFITTIDTDTIEKAKLIVENLKDHEFTYKYFMENPDKDIRYQYPLYWEYKGEKCKALLDIIIIDHTHRTITPIDLKTIGESVWNFQRNVDRFRYDLQAAWYSFGVHETLAKKLNYSVNTFKFIVASTKYPRSYPLIYKCSRESLVRGSYGNKEFKGFEQLLEEYKWRKENDKWIFPVELYLNNGVIPL